MVFSYVSLAFAALQVPSPAAYAQVFAHKEGALASTRQCACVLIAKPPLDHALPLAKAWPPLIAQNNAPRIQQPLDGSDV